MATATEGTLEVFMCDKYVGFVEIGGKGRSAEGTAAAAGENFDTDFKHCLGRGGMS